MNPPNSKLANKKNILFSLVIFYIFFFPSITSPAGFEFYLSRKQGLELLHNVRKVALIYQFSKDTEKYSDFIKRINSDVNLKLKLAGIGSADFKNGVPILKLDLFFNKNGNAKIYFGTIGVSFLKASNFYWPKILGYSKVWGEGKIFTGADENDIRQVIKDMIDDFLNVYLDANPRKPNRK